MKKLLFFIRWSHLQLTEKASTLILFFLLPVLLMGSSVDRNDTFCSFSFTNEINYTLVAGINGIFLNNMTPCMDNGTRPEFMDDHFFVDVIVNFVSMPTTETLTIDGTLMEQPITASIPPQTTTHTFLQVKMRTNEVTIDGFGLWIDITASFNPNCTRTEPELARSPKPCSVCTGPDEGQVGAPYPDCWPSQIPPDPCHSPLSYAPIPGHPELTPERYIKIILHVFQKEDPTNLGTYTANSNPDNYTDAHVGLFNQWFNDPGGVNGFMANLCDDPNDLSPHMEDSRLRFLLEFGEVGKDIFFHPDNAGWGIGFYDCGLGNSPNYANRVKDRYVTGNGFGWAPFLPQSYRNFMSLPNQQNAFHVFLTRGTWVDSGSDLPLKIPDDNIYPNLTPPPLDCYQLWPGGFVYPSDVNCDSNGNPQSNPVQFLYGNYEAFLSLTDPNYASYGVYFPQNSPPPSSVLELGNGITGEIFHVLSLDHLSPLQAHYHHDNGDDGCDDTTLDIETNNLLGCEFSADLTPPGCPFLGRSALSNTEKISVQN